MGNELQTNHSSEWTPSLQEQQERVEHRRWIGGRAVTLLNHYWREDDPCEMTAAIGADWADVLEGLPQEVLQKACIQYQRDEPRRKPTPGAVYQIAMGLMPKPVAVAPSPERKPHVPTPEEKARNLNYAAELGFKPKRFGADT